MAGPRVENDLVATRGVDEKAIAVHVVGTIVATEGSVLANKLYVGNLPFSIGDGELQQAFEKFGTVRSASVILDRETGRSRGFGFVEFEESSSAQEAQQGMDGQDLGGRPLRVSEAHDRRGGR